ncbi:MAG: ATPase [Prosthecobacter sp.]|uniref:ATPase n=1 Tax=Prosthecobacter sp. TaxID=1965333 RepID=UPI0038FE48DB
MTLELISLAQAAAAHAPDAAAAAGITGSITMGLGGGGAAIGVGLVGSKAVEAVGRNPGAFGNILTLGIIAMALAEGLGIIAYLGGF